MTNDCKSLYFNHGIKADKIRNLNRKYVTLSVSMFVTYNIDNFTRSKIAARSKVVGASDFVKYLDLIFCTDS